MAKPIRRKTTVLTVDAGPERRAPARFYTLLVGGSGSEVVQEDLVPDGDELRTARRHEVITDAA